MHIYFKVWAGRITASKPSQKLAFFEAIVASNGCKISEVPLIKIQQQQFENLIFYIRLESS